jgi:hypothetical protein
MDIIKACPLFYELLVIIGLDEFVIFSEPVILPLIVALDMLVMLVSGVFMFCAFAEFRPIIANIPIIAARIGMINTNCFLIACCQFF